jgi:diguanylate cyclase (GGDEF)-like protein
MLLLHAVSYGRPLTLSWLTQELRQNALDYTYLTASTVTVFAILGLRLGTREEQLENSALTDPLTGLWNRRLAMSRLQEELARALRYGQPLSLLFIDVDWLKQVNDKGGHSAGDAALKTVADAIQSSCRVVDLAARFGGDEYMVIASNTAAVAGVSLGERIRTAVRERSGGTVSVSIGVADLTALKHISVTTLCQAADDALYRAKQLGRDRLAVAETASSVAGGDAAGLQQPHHDEQHDQYQ